MVPVVRPDDHRSDGFNGTRPNVPIGTGGERHRFMYIVYILKDSSGRFYKGLTNNLKRRLQEHRSGHTITTRRMSGLEVAYIEQYETFKEARMREKYLKTAAGRRFLKRKI